MNQETKTGSVMLAQLKASPISLSPVTVLVGEISTAVKKGRDH